MMVEVYSLIDLFGVFSTGALVGIGIGGFSFLIGLGCRTAINIIKLT